MSQSLRILTWNTQMRSWAMEVGMPPTIPPVTTAEKRAELISDGILASPFDYDIVCLCEVFDEDSRDILRKRLRKRFPWIVTKCDFGFIGTELGAAPLIDLPLQGMSFVSGLIFNPLSVLDYRPEDSGLMIFSKWPFATQGLITLPPDVVALLQTGPLGSAIPAALPRVAFHPYSFSSTTGADTFAAKGIAYAQIQRAPGQVYHVFFSHTQADDEHVEENADERGDQMKEVESFILACVGGFPATGEVFFMGDLNIRGELHDDCVPAAEWSRIFNNPGRLLMKDVIDLWGQRQCTGHKGLRDTGITATTRYHPQDQRLDYILGSAISNLAAQHLKIDYPLSSVPPGHPDVSYMSDHLPLQIDLAFPRPFSTPHGAMKVPAQLNFIDTQLIMEGQVVWYRFDKQGTYDFMLSRGADRCGYEVYLDTDLSRPRRQYHNETHGDFGQKFVLATAPFLVKVFPFSREGEVRFQFRAHLHLGISPDDSIQLPYGVPVPEQFPKPNPTPQLLNLDFFDTPWDDKDTKWFRLDGPEVDLGSPLEVTILVEQTLGDAPYGVRLIRLLATGWVELDRAGPGLRGYELKTSINKGEKYYVCIFRDDLPALRELEFVVTAKANVSLLRGGSGGKPRLICEDETSGWGADDIELDISVDGEPHRYIDNDKIGDMEQDSVRDLDQWIPDFLPYRKGVGFRVIELDDTSPNDIGSQTLLPHDQLGSIPSLFVVSETKPDGTVRGSLHVNVDDGTYDVQVTVSTYDDLF